MFTDPAGAGGTIMIYLTRLTQLSEKAQKHYRCKYILQIREKNSCTGYISPEYQKKFNKLADAKAEQKKLINMSF